jgi:hypothetical protein
VTRLPTSIPERRGAKHDADAHGSSGRTERQPNSAWPFTPEFPACIPAGPGCTATRRLVTIPGSAQARPQSPNQSGPALPPDKRQVQLCTPPDSVVPWARRSSPLR